MEKLEYRLINKKQCFETGMVTALILLIAGLFSNSIIFFQLSVFVLIVDLLFPLLFKPLAFIWFGFSKVLGWLSSRIILSLVYYSMVVPMGFARKLLKKDNLHLNEFGKNNNSAFISRGYTYSAENFLYPF